MQASYQPPPDHRALTRVPAASFTAGVVCVGTATAAARQDASSAWDTFTMTCIPGRASSSDSGGSPSGFWRSSADPRPEPLPLPPPPPLPLPPAADDGVWLRRGDSPMDHVRPRRGGVPGGVLGVRGDASTAGSGRGGRSSCTSSNMLRAMARLFSPPSRRSDTIICRVIAATRRWRKRPSIDASHSSSARDSDGPASMLAPLDRPRPRSNGASGRPSTSLHAYSGRRTNRCDAAASNTARFPSSWSPAVEEPTAGVPTAPAVEDPAPAPAPAPAPDNASMMGLATATPVPLASGGGSQPHFMVAVTSAPADTADLSTVPLAWVTMTMGMVRSSQGSDPRSGMKLTSLSDTSTSAAAPAS